MDAFSPPMPLSPDIAGMGFSSRKAAPGDIGDRLFHNLLRRLNEQDDGGVITAFSPGVESQNQPGSGMHAARDRTSNLRNILEGRVTLPAEDLPRLARFLESRGFPGPEIANLMKSLADTNGDIRMDRLTAGLKNLIAEKRLAAEKLVVDRSDILLVKEALFKMGLGAGQVRDVIDRAVNADGHITLRGLTSALGAHFSDVGTETSSRLAEVLQRGMGIVLRAGDIEQAAKDAGLDQALQRIAGDSSIGVREAAKREIASLMLSKGIPAGEVKQFLESLSVRRGESHGPENAFREQNTVPSKDRSHALREGPDIQARILKLGIDRQNGSWKESVIDILNREVFLTGRKAGAGTGNGPAGSTETIEEVLLGRLLSKQPGLNPSKSNASGTGHAAAAMNSAGETAGEAAMAASKAGRSRSHQEESATSRPMPAGEISLSRPERADSFRPVASAARSLAAAATLPEPLPKIVDRMIWMVNRGEQASRIQISPPELGRLDLSIVIKQGHLHAHVSAENPMVKEIIEANLQQLKQQLGNLGFTVERFDVSAGLDERRFAEFQTRARAGRRNGQGRGGKQEGQAVAGVDPDRPARNAMGELYRINVRV